MLCTLTAAPHNTQIIFQTWLWSFQRYHPCDQQASAMCGAEYPHGGPTGFHLVLPLLAICHLLGGYLPISVNAKRHILLKYLCVPGLWTA